MKKKGLIISTVVMVVVLIASLTTATYAWFTPSSITQIDPINFSVSSSSDVLIGLKTDNTYDVNATRQDFVYGATDITATFKDDSGMKLDAVAKKGTRYWSGTNGLGTSIDMQLDLSGLEMAVGSSNLAAASAPTTADLTALRTLATETATGMVKAKADATGQAVDKTSKVAAIAQKDYLDVVLGVAASSGNLTEIVCNITINPDVANLVLGMNAAIHVAWKVGGDLTQGADKNVDAYTQGIETYNPADITAINYKTTTQELGSKVAGGATSAAQFGGKDTVAINKGAVNIPISIVKTDGATTIDTTTVYQIHLLIWIDGADLDCNDNAQNVGSKILINFKGTVKE